MLLAEEKNWSSETIPEKREILRGGCKIKYRIGCEE